MRSFAVTAIALISSVVAQATPGYHAIVRPDNFEAVPACAPYEIVWTPSSAFTGQVNFRLIAGATQQTLIPVSGFFGSVDGAVGSFTWSVPCDEGSEAIYGLEIHQVVDNSIFQFSMPFTITPVEGGNGNDTTSNTEVTPPATQPPQTSTNPTESGSSTTVTALSTTSSSTSTITSTSMTSSSMPYSTLITATTTNSTTSVESTTAITYTSSTTSASITDQPESSVSTIPTSGASHIAGGSFVILAAAAALLVL